MDKVKNQNNFLQFFIIFLTSFLLGIFFSFTIGKNINNELLKSDNGEGLINILNDSKLDLSKFWEVYNIVKLNNYDSEGINKKELVDYAIKGLVDGLGDKHTTFFNKKETKNFNSVLAGDFEGIGAVIDKHLLGVKIDRIIKGSPAKKYGLKSGDIITKANGSVLEGLGIYESVEKIKGPAGTKVLLEVIRLGEKDILQVEVIRDKIKIPSVNFELLNDGNISYISINMFGEDTSLEFKKALKKSINTKGLIIDLRDNGGGYLQSAVSILSNLVENDKVLVTTKYKDIFSDITYLSINGGDIYKGKIVVLINENSASASEITAGALRDYNKAIIVGKKSYGKGSVQKPFDLKDGSMLKLTIAKWFTPNDNNIDGEGIIPDIEVIFKKEDYLFSECIKEGVCKKDMKEVDFKFYDRQLEISKEVLNNFIKNDAYKLSIDKYLEENEKYKPNLEKELGK